MTWNRATKKAAHAPLSEWAILSRRETGGKSLYEQCPSRTFPHGASGQVQEVPGDRLVADDRIAPLVDGDDFRQQLCAVSETVTRDGIDFDVLGDSCDGHSRITWSGS